MTIVRPFKVFMDLDSLFPNGDVSRMRVNPGSAIEIIDSVGGVALVHRGMGVAAENTVRVMVAGIEESSLGNGRGQAEPAGVEAVEETGEGFVFRIPFLKLEVEQRSDEIADANIADHEAVELVAVDGEVAQTPIFPLIFVVHADPDQMGHNFGQAVVVIAFDPDDFDVALGIGELANEAEEFPMLFFEASEIEVGKDIAQEDEAAKLIFPENAQGLAGAAHVSAEVQIGKDQRVTGRRCDDRRSDDWRCDDLRRHSYHYRGGVLLDDELGTGWRPEVTYQ